MAFISLESIMDLLPGNSISRRNDPQYWSGWLSFESNPALPHRTLTVSAVHLEENGLELTVKDGETTYKLKAVPRDASHTTVYLNDEKVEGAALVFALKGNPFNPTRFGFDFRPIPLGAEKARFNMRYDP